jgi:RimJ/RimL family protein N-acetyltransferase
MGHPMHDENQRHRLLTDRLQLRWLTLDDVDLMLAVWNDPAFIRHVGDRGIRTEEQARDAMSRGAIRLYEEFGYGPWRVALHDDTAVGICGLFRRDGLDEPDIGFSTLPEYCGNGYAYEAARAVIGHAADVLGLPRLTALVSPGNAASVGLIRKLGLQFETMVRMAGDDYDVAVYAMPLAAESDQ